MDRPVLTVLRSWFQKPTALAPTVRPNLAIQYFRLPTAPVTAEPAEPIRPADYFDGATQIYRRVHPTELLNVHVELVEQIYQATGMDRAEFRRRIYPMLEFAAAAYQLVPASANNHHREPGGLLLHSLQVCRHAVHLGQFARFERDRSRSVSPEHHKQWSMALVLAALTHDSGKLLTDFRVVHPSFFAPGRLRPRLEEGAPAEDECGLFVPFNDTLFQWLARHGYREYLCHWLPNRFGQHEAQSAVLINTWINRMNIVTLPEKVRRTLATPAPRPGTVESDFWEIIRKSDQRSTTQYFPSVAGRPGAVIGDTLRRLVGEGTWQPSTTRYPLLIAPNQRLLLRYPADLSHLAYHMASHPEAHVLSASGPAPVDALAAHLQFECLIEINAAMEASFAAGALAAGSETPGQRVMALNERLSRELLDLARRAPARHASPGALTDSPEIDRTGLAAPRSTESAVATRPPPPVLPVTTAATSVVSAPPALPQTSDLPALVTDFLEYVATLRPGALFAADCAGQPRAAKGLQLEDLRFEPVHGGCIMVGRRVIQSFKQRTRQPLDSVVSTLIGCTRVVTHVEPPPPRATQSITLSAPASASLLSRPTASAVHSPAPAARSDRPPPPQAPAPVARLGASSASTQSQPSDRAIALLFRVFAHPPLHDLLSRHPGQLPQYVRAQTLGTIVEAARREMPQLVADLDADGLAQLFVDNGLPVARIPGGLRLDPDITRYWRRYVSEVAA